MRKQLEHELVPRRVCREAIVLGRTRHEPVRVRFAGVGEEVRRVVREAGGTIELEDRKAGEGACFVVKLPIAVLEDSSDRHARPPSDDAANALEGVRAVVIDDESPVLSVIVRTLESRGMRIVLATTEPEKGLETALRERPDIVLTDCKMPDMSGPQLLERIAEHDAELARRVVLVTGDTTNADLTALAARQGVRVLAKPFQLDDLERVVLETLRASRATS